MRRGQDPDGIVEGRRVMTFALDPARLVNARGDMRWMLNGGGEAQCALCSFNCAAALPSFHERHVQVRNFENSRFALPRAIASPSRQPAVKQGFGSSGAVHGVSPFSENRMRMYCYYLRNVFSTNAS